LVSVLSACEPAPTVVNDEPPTPGTNAPEAALDPASAGVETIDDPPTLLVIGIDGADMRWVDRLVDEGRLPNFARLIAHGVAGPLETVHYASPIIWTSIATGVQPWRHGIGGFLAQIKPDGSRYVPPEHAVEESSPQELPKIRVLPSGRERPSSVASRKRPAFWNILSHYDRSVGVLAWWATYPAEHVNGYMLSPYLVFAAPKKPGTANVRIEWTDEDEAKAFPPGLGSEAGPMMHQAAEVDRERHASVLGVGAQTPYTPWVLARDRSYYEATLYTLGTRPVDCVAVYFQGPDVASHDFTYWTYGRNVNEKRPARVSEEEVRAGLRRVESMYEYMDELVGGLLARVGPEANVMIVSDHGWEYDGTSHWNLNPGIFIAAGPGFRRGARVADVSVLDITPLLLAVLDVPVAEAFDGSIPEGVLVPGIESRVRFVDDYPIPAVDLVTEPSETVSPEEEKMMELLRGLGYIE
jgi:hypothetical protein